jgi:nucleotide-binding universal stress UspA family protein
MTQPFTKILVPTDFSDGAKTALDRALDLRQRFGATVTLLHIYELPTVYTDVYVFSADLIGTIERGARERMARTLEYAEKRARELDPTQAHPAIDGKVMAGAGAYSIVDVAKSGGYDLIVMGTHGRTGIRHLLIGSVAERVVRTAPCPVLTIRSSDLVD